jgi:branched-subunit amino acid aminotransferase/4-amino-4-deoxychorismate lyase
MPDSAPVAYLYGRVVPQSDALLRVDDAGFLFGATVVDRCRTYRHRLFRLSDHIARFRQSCLLARVPLSVSDGELTGIAEKLVTQNLALLAVDQDLTLVMFATPGVAGKHSGRTVDTNGGSATLGLYTFPLAPGQYAPLFRSGARLVIPATRHLPAACIDPRIKHRSRLHWWLAEQEVKQIDPQASALLLDRNGHVTETSGANFLIVQRGTVLSPLRESILGGIGLKVIEELCGEMSIPFREQALTASDCRNANEAMLTCSSYGVAGVSRIDDTQITWPGPVFQRLLDTFGKRVGLDVASQMCAVEPT